MRLLAHNVMASHIKGVKNGYPFGIEAREVRSIEANFDAEFVVAMLPRLRYDVLFQAATQVSQGRDRALRKSRGSSWVEPSAKTNLRFGHSYSIVAIVFRALFS